MVIENVSLKHHRTLTDARVKESRWLKLAGRGVRKAGVKSSTLFDGSGGLAWVG